MEIESACYVDQLYIYLIESPKFPKEFVKYKVHEYLFKLCVSSCHTSS